MESDPIDCYVMKCQAPFPCHNQHLSVKVKLKSIESDSIDPDLRASYRGTSWPETS